MNPTLKAAIFEHSVNQGPLFLKYVENVYGEYLSSAEDVLRFARKHEGLPLPDELFLPNPRRNIGVSLHTPLVNGLVHAHNFFEVIFVAEGEIIERVDDEELYLSTGTVCIHNPNAMHQIIKCDDSDCLVNLMIRKDSFTQNVFLPIIQDPVLSHFFLHFETMERNPNYMLFQSEDQRVSSIVDLIAEEFLDPHSNEVLLMSMVFLLFGTLIKGVKTNSFADQLTRYISEHLKEATIPSCAKNFGYHEKYFSTLVKRKMGKSFKQLLTEMRMRRAQDLLTYTDRTISDIAMNVGYQEPPVFYANFKKATGMTPAEFRLRP